MLITFHASPYLKHQQEHAEWFAEGFRRHGIELKITPQIIAEGDIHIVSGPWYAKQAWLDHPRVILIDRAYLPTHQIKSGKYISEDFISVGWMTKTGGRKFYENIGRSPIQKGFTEGTKSIFLCDYKGKPTCKVDMVRWHPNDVSTVSTLEEDLSLCDRAYGYHTSALVTAALMGLKVTSFDPEHILNQENWLQLLPYADHSADQIKSGETWELMREHLP